MEEVLTAAGALRDLVNQAQAVGYRFSTVAYRIFQVAEERAFREDVSPLLPMFAWAVIEVDEQFRTFLVSRVGSTSKLRSLIDDGMANTAGIETYQDEGLKPYTSVDRRELSTRARVIDLAIGIASENMRREISSHDVIEAIFKVHDEIFPVETNDEWSEPSFQTPYNSLAHLFTAANKAFDIPFAVVLRALDIPERSRSPVEEAPPAVRSALLNLFQDHPDFRRNCLLIMSFSDSRLHLEIATAIREALKTHGFNVLRADDRVYAEDLLVNVQAYMHGCSLAVAVFERLHGDVYNPNVSFEVGYFCGMRRPVCLLKDGNLPKLHSDIAGRLYEEFDVEEASSTIPTKVSRWLKDRKII